jgi:hypothetical protein
MVTLGDCRRGHHRRKEGPSQRRAHCTGAGEESRTPDLRITNALLYQLSYAGDMKPDIIADAGRRCQPAVRDGERAVAQ